ncbi:hypothetical protein CC78DRAFT_610986 [Lojkania enalia]|uniref:Rhodopsin domain-containing protein n=1 Tax=Lojkania enalia TaxID=147567 RepID=A0A9P4TS23_9PLEO|nr:hypothetical protein CC78DRAFT_610986 [Didymosphaeria enalia]
MASTKDMPNENEGPAILGATLTVALMALVTLVIRLYVRMVMIRNVGWDDYTMIVAMCMVIAGVGVIIPEVQLGAGRHIQHISPEDFMEAYKLNYVTQPIFLFAICIVKESIGFFLLRVAVTPFYRRLIIGIMIFMGLYTFGCFLTIVLQCTNLAVLWDRTAKGTCWGKTTLAALSYTNVALNITTDLLFAIIPVPMLWNVQMNIRQKSSIIGILSLGIFATAAAVVKISYLPNYGKTGDWLWDSRNITIWTVVECCIGIVAGNLPCMKPLFRTVLGSTYGRGSRNRGTPKYLSRPYGAGTGHGGSKNYNSLASHSMKGGPYRSEESHMMTKIAAKDRSVSRSSSRDDSPRKNSAESVAWLNDQSLAKLGGITKTTDVNVFHEHHSARSAGPSDIEERMRPEQKEAHMCFVIVLRY